MAAVMFNNSNTTPFGPERPTVDLSYRVICKDCKNPVPNIIEDFSAGDLVCGDCGLVLGNRIIDNRSEWRTFSNNDEVGDDPSRVGAVRDELLGGQNHIESTMVGMRDGGSGFARDLNRAHAKATAVKSEKVLLHAFKDIQSMGERIGLSKVVIDAAKQFYKKVEEDKLLRGKSQDAIMAACIFIACRQQKVGRTFKEIVALTGVSKKEIGKCFKFLNGLIDTPMQVAETSLDSYVARFASLLGVTADITTGTRLLAQRAMETGALAGKSPITIVAACLYFISNLSKTPKPARDIAEIAGCTEATLKNAYRILFEQRDELLPKDVKLPSSLAPSRSPSPASSAVSTVNNDSGDN